MGEQCCRNCWYWTRFDTQGDHPNETAKCRWAGYVSVAEWMEHMPDPLMRADSGRDCAVWMDMSYE